MKQNTFLIAALFLLGACTSPVDIHRTPLTFTHLPTVLQADLVVLLETDKYLVVTTLGSFRSDFQHWLREHAYLTEDSELLAAVNQAIIKQPTRHPFMAWRADSIAKAQGLVHRLAYRASDLLETNKCFVYNKKSHLIETTCRRFSTANSGYEAHGFAVSKDMLLEVVDRVY
jgi:hypothetical protein